MISYRDLPYRYKPIVPGDGSLIDRYIAEALSEVPEVHRAKASAKAYAKANFDFELTFNISVYGFGAALTDMPDGVSPVTPIATIDGEAREERLAEHYDELWRHFAKLAKNGWAHDGAGGE